MSLDGRKARVQIILVRNKMALPSARVRRRNYPSSATVRSLVRAAQECGIPVGGFEVTREGCIRVYDRNISDRAKAKNDFDQWEGQL